MKPTFIKFVAALAALPLLLASCGKEDNEKIPTGPQYTDEGVEFLGTIWATRNVAAPGTFAENPEDFGMYYQWNRRTGWEPTTPISSSDGSYWNGADYVDLEWSSKNDPCPIGWRLPTRDENQLLEHYSAFSFTILNGVPGAQFVDPETGGRLFLPATGYIAADGAVTDQGYSGHYRSSARYPEDGYGYVVFFRADWKIGSGDGEGFIFPAYKWPPQNGYSIRCVKK